MVSDDKKYDVNEELLLCTSLSICKRTIFLLSDSDLLGGFLVIVNVLANFL